MANEDNFRLGWIALFRSIDKHPIMWQRPYTRLAVWIHLLVNVGWKERTVSTDLGPIIVPIGGVLTSSVSIAKHLKLPRDSVRSACAYLQKNLMIHPSQVTNRFTVYVVDNFGAYQEAMKQRPQLLPHQLPQQVPSRSPADPQQLPTNKKEEVRSEEGKTTTCAPDGAREWGLTAPEFQPNVKKSKSGPATCGWKWEAFQMFWSEYWRRTDKKPAWAAYHELIVVPQDAADCKAAMLKIRPAMLERDQEKRPMGATWLHRRTWLPEFADSEEVPREDNLDWAVAEAEKIQEQIRNEHQRR